MISARCFYYSNKKLITQQNNCLVVSDIMLNKFKLNMHFFLQYFVYISVL